MDPITFKELIKSHVALQERGLSFDGATKAVSRAHAETPVLMDDGETVSIEDINFEAAKVEKTEDAKSITLNVSREIKSAVESGMSEVKALRVTESDESDDLSKVKVPATAKRYRAKSIRGVKHGMEADQRAYLAGCFYLSAIAKSLPRLSQAFPNAEKTIARYGMKVASEGVNSLGGFAVPEQFGTDIIDLREEYGVARQLLKNRPMTSDTRTDPRRLGGLTAYFVGESTAGTESTKTWDEVRLVAKKLMALTRYTNELNEDAVISIGDDITQEIAYAFSLKEDQCAFLGDGTSTYGGIVGFNQKLVDVNGVDDGGGLTLGAGNAYSELTLANFESVVGRLPQYAAAGARWVASRSVYWNVMKKLELASGGVTAAEVASGSTDGQFLGYPVTISQVMPATEADSQVCALFGNFSLAGSFGDRTGIGVDFSEHATIGGENVFERNQIAVRGIERFDINVHDVGTATAAGPVVGLITAAS